MFKLCILLHKSPTHSWRYNHFGSPQVQDPGALPQKEEWQLSLRSCRLCGFLAIGQPRLSGGLVPDPEEDLTTGFGREISPGPTHEVPCIPQGDFTSWSLSFPLTSCALKTWVSYIVYQIQFISKWTLFDRITMTTGTTWKLTFKDKSSFLPKN